MNLRTFELSAVIAILDEDQDRELANMPLQSDNRPPSLRSVGRLQLNGKALGFNVWAIIEACVLVLVFASAADCADDTGLSKVAIVSSEWTTGSESAPFSPQLEFELALGDNIEAQVVELTPQHDSKDTFRVQAQFETALAVGDEGPHLDLVAWHGCKSPWRDAEELSSLRFRLPRPTEAEQTCLPNVSVKEIRAEVARRGGKRWARLLKDIRSPTSEPLYVAIAYVHVAVQRRILDAWRTVLVIHIRVPMGC